MSEKNFETELISDEERRYRAAHKDEPDDSKNPYLITPSARKGDDEDENISDEERRYRALHENKPVDETKNPYLLSPLKNSAVNPNAEYMSGAEKNFRKSHKNEFYSRRANPYILPRGKTPEEIGRDIDNSDGNACISSAERRYRARHRSAHSGNLAHKMIVTHEDNHSHSSGGTLHTAKRKIRKAKHKIKHKIKRVKRNKRRLSRNLPMPMLVISRFLKFFVICALLSSLSTFLFTRGFIAADDRDLLLSLSAMVGIYIVINLFVFKRKLKRTRGSRKYYKTNYIAYSIFAGINLILCLLSLKTAYIQVLYTWLFSITKFIKYSHLEIPNFISACAFHLLMYFTLAILTRVRLRMGLIKR